MPRPARKNSRTSGVAPRAGSPPPAVVFFAHAAAFRRWLRSHHARDRALQVGFHRKGSGRPGLTYPEAVDEALCFGWIDGMIRRLDATSFTHRFTPRKPGSIWSKVNVDHVARLTALGRMQPAGLAAFAARTAARTGVYSYEQKNTPPGPADLPPALAIVLRENGPAWTFWQPLAPSYRRKVVQWITGATQASTRERRLQRLVLYCAAGRRLDGK